MSLGFHKDSLLNLVELAAKEEEKKGRNEAGGSSSNKKRQQQSAGISSTESRSFPRSSSFGNETQRDELTQRDDSTTWDSPSLEYGTSTTTTLIRVTSDNSINPDNVAASLDVDLSDSSAGSAGSSLGKIPYEDPTNRARPARWVNTGDKVVSQQNVSYGTDLDDYYDPYASTISMQQSTNKRSSTNNRHHSNCLCIFAPWGHGSEQDDIDDSDMEEDDSAATVSEKNSSSEQDAAQNGTENKRAEEDNNGTSSKEKQEIGKGATNTQSDAMEIDTVSSTINKEEEEALLKSQSTPQRAKQNYITAKRDSSSPREKLLRKTLEQVQKLHATEEQQQQQQKQPSTLSNKTPSRILSSYGSNGKLRHVPPSATCVPPEKSSLKINLISLPSSDGSSHGSSSRHFKNGGQSNTSGRRSIFVTKSGPSSTDLSASGRSIHASFALSNSNNNNGVRKTCRFAPTARVATIPSRHTMSPFDRSLIWWTRADYESFKKTGRMIARAMLEGGSDIWLQSQFTREERKKFDQSDEIADSSSSMTTPTKSESNDQNFGEKWWCKFGHSRRGLEHIANMEEGRLRQKSVQNAMDTVIKEQRKQRMSSGGNISDPGKLARIYQQYTRWAKELAILAGLGDAEAVRNDFHSYNAPITSRSKMTRSSMYTSYVTRNFNFTSEVAEENARQSCWNPGVLDEHTSTSLLIKLNDEFDMHTMAEEGSKVVNGGKTKEETKVQANNRTQTEPNQDETTNQNGSSSSEGSFSEEPINDVPNSRHGCIAKKAAGLGQGENDLDRFLEKRFEKKVPVH